MKQVEPSSLLEDPLLPIERQRKWEFGLRGRRFRFRDGESEKAQSFEILRVLCSVKEVKLSTIKLLVLLPQSSCSQRHFKTIEGDNAYSVMTSGRWRERGGESLEPI